MIIYCFSSENFRPRRLIYGSPWGAPQSGESGSAEAVPQGPQLSPQRELALRAQWRERLYAAKSDVDTAFNQKFTAQEKAIKAFVQKKAQEGKTSWRDWNKEFAAVLKVDEKDAAAYVKALQRKIFQEQGLAGDADAHPDGKLGPYTLAALAAKLAPEAKVEIPHPKANTALVDQLAVKSVAADILSGGVTGPYLQLNTSWLPSGGQGGTAPEAPVLGLGYSPTAFQVPLWGSPLPLSIPVPSAGKWVTPEGKPSDVPVLLSGREAADDEEPKVPKLPATININHKGADKPIDFRYNRKSGQWEYRQSQKHPWRDVNKWWLPGLSDEQEAIAKNLRNSGELQGYGRLRESGEKIKKTGLPAPAPAPAPAPTPPPTPVLPTVADIPSRYVLDPNLRTLKLPFNWGEAGFFVPYLG